MGRGLHAQTVEIITTAIGLLREIKPATVRGVAYKLFTLGLIPDMSKRSTDKVSKALVRAREAEALPWQWLVDETREVEQAAQWHDGTVFIRSVLSQYRKDYWQDQPYHVEVVSEKGTVRGVLAPVLDEFGVPFRVMHGFASATVAHDMAEAINARGKPTILLYAGDWDPSGLCMSEADLPLRLRDYGARAFRLDRIALTKADVKAGSLPFFPAESKRGDSRYAWFVRNYGARCWELDALDPRTLRERVRNSILRYLDVDAWNHMIEIERAERESMQTVMTAWKRTLAGGQS